MIINSRNSSWAVTKIYHCWVYSMSRQGIEELGSSFGSIFAFVSNKSVRGCQSSEVGVESPANSDSPACSQAMSGKRHLMELLYFHSLVR